MRIRIVSEDGTFAGSKVQDAATGELVEGVTAVSVRTDNQTHRWTATLTIEMPSVDIVAEAVSVTQGASWPIS